MKTITDKAITWIAIVMVPLILAGSYYAHTHPLCLGTGG